MRLPAILEDLVHTLLVEAKREGFIAALRAHSELDEVTIYALACECFPLNDLRKSPDGNLSKRVVPP